MTSKEALKKVKNIGKEVNPSMYQVKELSRCCGVIKKDLEVLEALKENYSGAIKRENHLMINDMDLVDARDVKVKEWLKNEEDR